MKAETKQRKNTIAALLLADEINAAIPQAKAVWNESNGVEFYGMVYRQDVNGTGDDWILPALAKMVKKAGFEFHPYSATILRAIKQ